MVGEPKYPWQQAVIEAFLEMNPQRLPGKINAAQRAIATRLCDRQPLSVDEHLALEDAQGMLRILILETEVQQRPGDEEETA